MGLEFASFFEFGLVFCSPDSEAWRVCQREELMLITANRNHDGTDSLGATIRSENALSSLPVLSLADADQAMKNADYARTVAIRMLEILDEIDL